MEAMRTSSMNRHIVDDLKQIGLCLATCLLLIFIHCEATIGAVQNSKESMAMNPSITWQNERLTIKAKAVPLQDLLDRVAKTCDLRIFSASADKTTLVDVDMQERTIEQSLKELLRGHSYLTIYNEVAEKTGLVLSDSRPASDEPEPARLAGATNDDLSKPVVDEKQAQAEYLRGQIETLNERIASGESDSFYENAIKFKDPRFVQNDRQELASYQEKLARLEGNI